jgi:hypothetical protein
MIEYLRVKLGDYIRFMPKWRKLFYVSIMIFGFVLFVPIPPIPYPLEVFGVISLAGWFFAFWGVISFVQFWRQGKDLTL